MQTFIQYILGFLQTFSFSFNLVKVHSFDFASWAMVTFKKMFKRSECLFIESQSQYQ